MRYTLSKTGYKKKRIGMLLLPALVLGLGGCASGGIFTDAGTDLTEKRDVSQYLDLSALELQSTASEDGSWNGYEVYTLEYGTFSSPHNGIKAELTRIEATQVKAEFEAGSMQLVEMYAIKGEYVEKGDVLASVLVETSDLDLEELKLKLKRTEEAYEKETTAYLKKQEEATAKISVYELPAKIDRIKIAQAEIDFERAKENYEKQIESLQKQIRELERIASTREILAPESGFLLNVNNMRRGTELKNGDVICWISAADNIFLEIPDDIWRYGYGKELELTAGGWGGTDIYTVKVVSASGKVLKDNWEIQTAMVDGDYHIEDLMGKAPYVLTTERNVMRNVLLIPFNAVTKTDGRYYVTVLHDDNTLEKRQFLPGGQNADYYWVFDGLEEGTKIIIEN